MAFARWDPLRDLLAIQQRLDRFAPGPAGWVPPVDLYETAADYVIIAELPGLRREDLQIHVQENRVRLTGARRGLPRICEQHHRVERGHGSFDRTFQLPHPIDPDRIVADLLDGVLTVTCPKAVEAGARRVRIS
ncbi:MAG: Hsp20/alpha crystallin family protein [Vicinamibacterales bacterium]